MTPADETTLIKGALILTMAPSQDEPAVGDIRFDENGIREIAADIPPLAGERIVDGRDRLVMPGLVNAHTHSFEMTYRARYERLPMELWALFGFPTIGATPLSARLIYLRSMVVAIEALKSGVTTILDDVDEWDGQTLDSLAPIFAAYDDAGIRASVSGNFQNLFDVDVMPFADEVFPEDVRHRLSPGNSPSDAYYLDFLAAGIDRFHQPTGRLQFVVAPCGPQWVSESLLGATADLARSRGVNFHLHALETRLQVLSGREVFGRSHIQVLADAGGLDRMTTIAHGIWLTDHDVALIASAGASIVHNPISNLKLGAGVASLRQLLDAGVNVGLGTDGPSCNDTVRIFDTMRVAALIHSVTAPAGLDWPTAREIVHAATVGGARAANVGERTGWLAPGRQADVIVLDLRSVSFTPLGDIYKHLAYSENGSSIRQVYAAGRLVVDDDRLTLVDEDAILDEFRSYLPEFRRMHAALEETSREFEPYIAEVQRRCAVADLGPSHVPSHVARG